MFLCLFFFRFLNIYLMWFYFNGFSFSKQSALRKKSFLSPLFLSSLVSLSLVSAGCCVVCAPRQTFTQICFPILLYLWKQTFFSPYSAECSCLKWSFVVSFIMNKMTQNNVSLRPITYFFSLLFIIMQEFGQLKQKFCQFNFKTQAVELKIVLLKSSKWACRVCLCVLL